MEYKALTQNTSTFTKTTTITTSTVLSDPLRYMFGTFYLVKSDGTKTRPYIFAPYSYKTYYVGSTPWIDWTSSTYRYETDLASCEVDGITYYGTRQASFYYPRWGNEYSLVGIIKVVMYSSAEKTIISNEYNVNLTGPSNNDTWYLMIPKLSDDIILTITFEEAPKTLSE